MLSTAENETLCRVGPGTPMGDLLRLYWVPLLFSSELPEPDGKPLRTRIFGEDLIAFRASDGQVGLLGDHCPHRGASLYFGRNEDQGLRCVYHGWKFDLAGNCVDMPNEPSESDYKSRIRHTAYLCRERNGVIWAYLGDRARAPELPQMEWNLVPDSHLHLSKRVATNNWVQALEGEIDSAHAGFLHGKAQASAMGGGASSFNANYDVTGQVSADRAPRLATQDMDYGVAIAAGRSASDGASRYWRLNQFLLPFWTLVPPSGRDATISGHAWIPIDDTKTLCFMFTYHPTQPMTDKFRDILSRGRHGRQPGHLTVDGMLPATNQAHGAFYPKLNWSNDFGHDWADKDRYFSSLPGIWPQDSGCQESMGSIYDRSQEHLGTTDMGIMQMRKALLRAARELRETGAKPPGATDPGVFAVRSVAIQLPNEETWTEGALKHRFASGPYGYPVPQAMEE